MKKNLPFKLFIFSLIIFMFRIFVFDLHHIEGHSMDPNYSQSLKIMSSKVFKIDRFDVVIAKEQLENGDELPVVKRVIGLPGDRIRFEYDVLYINGEKFDEPYIQNYLQKYKEKVLDDEYNKFSSDWANVIDNTRAFTTNYSGEPIFDRVLESNEYYLLGDNRPLSKDSRHVGPFKGENIESQVITILPKSLKFK